MKFELPKLNYDYDALEPYIDEATMRVHHDKHHATYMEKFQAAVDKIQVVKNMSAEEIIKNLYQLNIKEDERTALKNHGGGYVNHNLFFEELAPTKDIDKKLVGEIEAKWGAVDNFKKEFSTLALGHFGSGWVWLVRDEKGELQIYALPNQESPLSRGHQPIINLDIWEHAYYLKYQNRRAEYVEAWWRVVKIL
jgi:Fe-Mn family superoxide dismutase